MIAIKQFPDHFGQSVSCACRIFGRRDTWNEKFGRLNYQVHLSDFSGEAHVLIAPAIQDRAHELKSGMVIQADIEPRAFGTLVGGILHSWSLGEIPENIARVLPHAQCPSAVHASLQKLVDLIDRISVPAARRCLADILEECSSQFLTAMGGWKYHHNYAGGLLAHSVSVALLAEENARRIHPNDSARVDVIIVAALLHDIGKALQVQKGPRGAVTTVLRHEPLALPMTFHAINRMGKEWPDGASRLTEILSWLALPKIFRRQFPDAQLVHHADATDVMIDRARNGRLDDAA